ncbi:hypothetical protein [Curtobacterium sp. MCJR17_043]|uniref:hypothetical protein n=1 Tax=Curtobacterium sp. MCJR17_043 TaxID=2175660 RepID=UPI0024DF611E|nr:hypothetical protein [Curtobacterium sp. MCJR17_043]WIB35999.1 hypothetical protein DEJ15_01540 [Curtobacterium sp. MCJR17_043]
MLGCVVLCLVGTVGAPRRTVVRRLHGRSTWAVVLTEVAEVRTTLVVTALLAPVVALGLWAHNGLATWTTFAVAAAVCCSPLLVPVVACHALGTVIASRRPIALAVRGDRPSAALVLGAQAARLPAVVVLVAAVFDLTSAAAVARSASAAQDLRAAGDTVQLWVTPDPRPGSDTQPYWDRIGGVAGAALDQHRALLSAATEVSTGVGRGTVPALFVDPGYLRRQDLRTAAGGSDHRDRGPDHGLDALRLRHRPRCARPGPHGVGTPRGDGHGEAGGRWWRTRSPSDLHVPV